MAKTSLRKLKPEAIGVNPGDLVVESLAAGISLAEFVKLPR
jgi:hypothetical protein